MTVYRKVIGSQEGTSRLAGNEPVQRKWTVRKLIKRQESKRWSISQLMDRKVINS